MRTGLRDERAVAMEMIYRYAGGESGGDREEVWRMELYSGEPGALEVAATGTKKLG